MLAIASPPYPDTMALLRSVVLVGMLHSAVGLRIPIDASFIQRAKAATAAVALSAVLTVQPAFSGVPEAAKDLTDAAYPIIASLKKDTVAPLTGKAIGVALSANPKEIIKTIDSTLLLPVACAPPALASLFRLYPPPS